MDKTIFTDPDLNTFCGLDGMGLIAVGQHVTTKEAVLACKVVPDPQEGWCRECGGPGTPAGSLVRRLAHIPYGNRPTTLHIRLRRFRCPDCRRVWTQDLTAACEPRAKLSRGALRWALIALVVMKLSISKIAEQLNVAWNTANTAILDEGQRHLIDDPTRFDGVRVLGVDEHVWRHTRRGDKYVTVIIDLTPVYDGTGTARLLDMVEGRSKAVFKDWLQSRPQAWRDQVEVVAMDGFTGFKTATQEELNAVAVLDPFHVVRLGGDAVTTTRQRVQQELHGHRGRKGEPLYMARQTLLTGKGMLTEKNQDRLADLFAEPVHEPVHTTWKAYQQMVAAYRHKNPIEGKAIMENLITSLKNVPQHLVELRKLARTLARRASDILAYFDLPRTSNGPTEAINGRIEHLRGSALGFRNLTHYIARCLLNSGGFQNKLHPQL